MNIGEAVKERILELCSERDISINKLCCMSGVTPIHSKQYHQRTKPQRHHFYDQEAMRWSGNHD